MADSQTQQPVDSTQQVTSKTHTTSLKNPKRVAAGKATAEKTKQAREAQKKAYAEANIIIANNQLKQSAPPVVDPPNQLKQSAPPAVGLPVVDTLVESKSESESTKNILTTTQWLSVIGIIVSLARIYYKREEIKSLLTPKQPQANTPPHLLILRQKEKESSARWIELSLCFNIWINQTSKHSCFSFSSYMGRLIFFQKSTFPSGER